MKRIIKLLLRKLGYEIRPLNLNGASDSISYNLPEGTDKFYGNNRLAHEYINKNVPVHIKNLISILKKKKLELNNKRTIDVGCGTGHCLKELKIRYPKAYLMGTETSNEAIKIALDVAQGIVILKKDILDPLTENYDLVLCQQVLEHIADAELALLNLWNLTTPGGYLLITVPDGRLDSFSGHVHFWGKESFTLLLNKTLPSKNIEIGHLQDEVSLYALIRKAGLD